VFLFVDSIILLQQSTVQTSPHQYEYPGYPYPEHIRNRTNPPTPTGEEVRTYLHNFCQSHNILEKFQYDTTVANITKHHTTGPAKWTLIATTTDCQTNETRSSLESFSFVIICTGLFSNTPNMLNIPGTDDFINQGHGKIIHTSQWKDTEEFRDQNIIIIGNGKSAADAAVAASKMAQLSTKKVNPPIQCIRKQNWYVPRLILKYKCLFHSRLVAYFLPRYYEETSTLSFILHYITRPIKYILWRILEIIFIVLLRLPYKVWPTFGTIDSENSLSVPLLVTDERHLQPIRDGKLDLRITQVVQLYGTKHAKLLSGDIVPVDLIVMGTGWKLDYSFFDKETVLSKLNIESDGLWLYRNIIPPNISRLAFIGSNALTFMNIYTSYVQAYWLVHLISGQRQPISSNDMNTCIQREKIFKRKLYPYCPIRGASIEAYMQQYHDLLFQEQGINPYIYTGLFAPIYNMLWPVLPETMTPSYNIVRSTYSHQKKVE
jgi:dimethylaniline monooxygenase (N-oxide forming)